MKISSFQPENGSDSQSVQSMASSGTSNDGARAGVGVGVGGAPDGVKGDGGGGKIKKKFRKGKQDKKKESTSNVTLADTNKVHCIHVTMVFSIQLSPEQVAPFGSTSQLHIDDSTASLITTDNCINRDDFTATAKISKCVLCT